MSAGGRFCATARPIRPDILRRSLTPVEGYCDRSVVDMYFARVLLPSIPKGSVIILDNASFHRSPSTLAIVEAAGCALMFLPAYSPDLNPIEHAWATLNLQNALMLSKISATPSS